MVDRIENLAAMQAGYEDVEILGQTEDLLSFSYRDAVQQRPALQHASGGFTRAPATEEARFEMSASSAARWTARACRTCSSGRHQRRQGLPELAGRVRCRGCHAVEHGVRGRPVGSLRTCTHSSRFAATWTTRSTVTPPGQPV